MSRGLDNITVVVAVGLLGAAVAGLARGGVRRVVLLVIRRLGGNEFFFGPLLSSSLVVKRGNPYAILRPRPL